MSINESIKLVAEHVDWIGARQSLSRARDISKCNYRVTLACGNYIDLSLIDGIKMIEEFFKQGNVSPTEAYGFSADITRVINQGSEPSHLMPNINRFLKLCQRHIDLIPKDAISDDLAGGRITRNEARAALGLNQI